MKKILTTTGEYILDDRLIFGVYTNSENNILIDKISYRMLSPITNQRVYSDEELANPPYNYTKVEIDDKYSDCQASDFNDDLTFSIEKYNTRKQKQDNENRIAQIKPRLEQLSQDLIQAQAGAVFEDLEERKAEFQALHNELRALLGKEPREYVEQCKKQVKNVHNYEEVLANAINQESEQEGA